MAEKEAPRSFVKFVDDLADGVFAREAGEDLQRIGDELHSQALAQGSTVKGEMTIKLKMTCDKTGVCVIRPEIDLKMPKRPTVGGVMYMTKGGNFQATNPKQLELGRGVLKEVPPPKSTKRDDDEGTGGN